MEDNVLFDPQHIVCAVDLSPHSAAVVRAGEFMARMLDARLTVFHAVTIPHDRYPGTTIFERGGEQDDRMTAARRGLHKLVTPLAQAGTAVAAGDPVEMLSGFVRQNAVGLVVAARHGFSGIQRVLLGSVVERMARRLPVPLLVVGRTPAQDHASPLFSHVVAACQTADRRDPVLTTATAVARNFNVGLNLLHAVEQPVQPDLLEPTAGPYGEVQAALQERLHQGFVDTVGPVTAVREHRVDGLETAGIFRVVGAGIVFQVVVVQHDTRRCRFYDGRHMNVLPPSFAPPMKDGLGFRPRPRCFDLTAAPSLPSSTRPGGSRHF